MSSLTLEEHLACTLRQLSREELEEHRKLEDEFGSLGEVFAPNGKFSITISDSLQCTHKADAMLLCNIYEAIDRKWTGSETDVSVVIGAWVTTVRQALLCVTVAALGMKKKGHQYLGFTHVNQNPFDIAVCDTTKKYCVQFKCKITEAKRRLSGRELKRKIEKDFETVSYGWMLVRRGKKKVGYAEVFKHKIVLQFDKKITKRSAKKIIGKDCAFASCGKEGTKSCSRCKLVSYCSFECAKKNWGLHKKYCSPPLPEGVSVDLTGYEGFYEEPLCDFKDNETKLKLPIMALAYFDLLKGGVICLENLKDSISGWRKVRNWKMSVEGVEDVRNVTEELQKVDKSCRWFHEHFPKKAQALKIPKEFTTFFYE
tara:strand:+ start:146 stop:1255 length:1110 start_codon:yes stop_codon:yes gene_type:complete